MLYWIWLVGIIFINLIRQVSTVPSVVDQITFDTSCGILREPKDLRGTFIWLKLDARKFVQASNMGIGQPREIVSRGLQAINTICSFGAPSSIFSVLTVASNPIISHLTNAILVNNVAINVLNYYFELSLFGTNDINTNGNNVYTNETDVSICAIHVLC